MAILVFLVFMTFLTMLRANDTDKYIQLLEMQLNKTEQMNQFWQEKINLLEAKMKYLQADVSKLQPNNKWARQFSWTGFDPSAMGFEDNVITSGILGFGIGGILIFIVIAVVINQICKKTRDQQHHPDHYDHGDVKFDLSSHKGRWMVFKPNMYNAFAASALYQGHEFSFARACSRFGFYLIFNIAIQFFYTFYLWENQLVKNTKMQLSFDESYCSAPVFVVFFSVFLFVSKILVSFTYLIRQSKTLLCGHSYRVKSDGKTYTFGDNYHRGWHVCRRIALFVLCILPEALQLGFLMVVGAQYLSTASTIDDLIFNALALHFIIEIDEQLYIVVTCWGDTYLDFDLADLEVQVPSVKYNVTKMVHYCQCKCDEKHQRRCDNCVFGSLKFMQSILQVFGNLALGYGFSVYFVTWAQGHVGCSFCPGGPYCENMISFSHPNATSATVLTPFGIYWPLAFVFSMIIYFVPSLFCCKREQHKLSDEGDET